MRPPDEQTDGVPAAAADMTSTTATGSREPRPADELAKSEKPTAIGLAASVASSDAQRAAALYRRRARRVDTAHGRFGRGEQLVAIDYWRARASHWPRDDDRPAPPFAQA